MNPESFHFLSLRYRKTASASEVERFKWELSDNDYKWNANSPHVAASLLMDWLGGLKDSLIPQSYYDRAIGLALENKVKNKRLNVFFYAMSRERRRSIKYLIKFLRELVAYKNVPKTKVGLENVADIFAPLILRCPHKGRDSRWETRFIIGLIQEYNRSESRILRSETCPNLHL